MTDIKAQIAALKVEGYDDNRAISAQIEAIMTEQAELKTRFEALEQQKQAAHNAFAQREQTRETKIAALESMEADHG